MARGNAEALLAIPIAIESIESFVATSVEELSEFARPLVKLHLRQLLEIYNRRVDAVEMDKSLMIEIPRNLR